MEDLFRRRIHPELLNFYDASSGFDFDNLDVFVPKMNAMELMALRIRRFTAMKETFRARSAPRQ